MKNYIRQVNIKNLFESNNDYKINLTEGCNCIYGGNGTGKTTIINLIVNSLSLGLETIAKTPFTSLNIYLSKENQTRLRKFITITRTVSTDISSIDYGSVQLNYELFNMDELSLQHHSSEKDTFSLSFNFVLPPFGYDQRTDDKYSEIIYKLKHIISRSVNLTHIPLSRFYDGDLAFSRGERDELLHSALRRKNLSNSEISEILDPSAKVLSSLQRQFITQANENRKQINEKLERLKSSLIEKVMIDDALVKQVSKAFSKISKLLNTEPEDINVENSLSKLTEAGIDIPENKLKEHFTKWRDILATAKKDYQHMNSVHNDQNASSSKKFEASQRFNSSYFSLFAMTHFNDRFLSIVSDVENMQKSKSALTKSFKDYETEVNRYLHNKHFSLTDDGHLHVYVGTKNLNLSELSSGEKHILTILGRAALSSDDGTVFVADEPELSLHLDWQRKILPSVIKLSPKSQIIVATHSPSITSKNANEINLEDCIQ
ncbi:AAA family ATPase [Aeromonas veronii]|uniref:AAA family ATPase n=1 Tax=Aeromonas TaxID=642 RepID=UPI00300685BF